MEHLTELFLKKFLFRWLPHFFAFDPPKKNPSNSYMSFQQPTNFHPYPKAILGNA